MKVKQIQLNIMAIKPFFCIVYKCYDFKSVFFFVIFIIFYVYK